MEHLTLGQLATAVGTPPRWVLNALTRLRLRRRGYDEALARRLALARQLAEATRMPLPGAFAAAGVILKETDPHATWSVESPDGAVLIAVDLPRFYATYLPRLAYAMNAYGEKTRGPRRRRRGSALDYARAWGFDTTLFASALMRAPHERLAVLDESAMLARAVRRSLR
jgi:hypothetical protein